MDSGFCVNKRGLMLAFSTHCTSQFTYLTEMTLSVITRENRGNRIISRASERSQGLKMQTFFFSVVVLVASDVFMYADDTTFSTVWGRTLITVCLQLNSILEQLLFWGTMKKLCVHPIKSEVMILSKTSFTGPAPPMYFGNDFINIVSHTTCLGLVIDNRLTWATHVHHVKKSFAQKVGALKRMKKLPVKVLEEIYFKSILPSATYGTVVWGNCSSSIMDSLNPVQATGATRVIYQDESLAKTNWLPISYVYKRGLLLLMHDVLNDKALYPPFNLRLNKRPSHRGGFTV